MSDGLLVLSLLVVVIPALGLARPTIVGDLNKLVAPDSDAKVRPVEPLHKVVSVNCFQERPDSPFDK